MIPMCAAKWLAAAAVATLSAWLCLLARSHGIHPLKKILEFPGIRAKVGIVLLLRFLSATIVHGSEKLRDLINILLPSNRADNASSSAGLRTGGGANRTNGTSAICITAFAVHSNAVEIAASTDGLDAGYVVTLTNGVSFTRSVTRDPFRRGLVTCITNVVAFPSDGSIVPDASYYVNSPDGGLTNVFAYSYDALSRPISRNGHAFQYNSRSEVTRDGLGNWHFYFRDIYDWELNNGLAGGFVSDREKALLHRYGVAREFEMNGRHFIHVEWEKGQRLHTGAKVIGM